MYGKQCRSWSWCTSYNNRCIIMVTQNVSTHFFFCFSVNIFHIQSPWSDYLNFTSLWTLENLSKVLWIRGEIVPNVQFLTFYVPAYSKNSGRALSVTPVYVRPSVPIRVQAITPQPYGIYLWNFTGACMTLRGCVMNKEDNSCLVDFLNYLPLT